MTRATLGRNGQMILPEDICRAACLEEGDAFEVELTATGILLRPQAVVDATQAWFWSPGWLAGEREADADKAAGRVEKFPSAEDLLEALRGRAMPQRG